MNSQKIRNMSVSAMLIALSIVIPLFSPLKIQIDPASFTLASHLPIFIAMFISPMTALFVSLGATAGFFLAGFLPVVVLRAFTHVVFSVIGAIYIQKNPNLRDNQFNLFIFSFIIAIIHAGMEVVASTVFYTGSMAASGYFTSVIVLVGLGTIIHSMVDFALALIVLKYLKHTPALANKA